MGQAAKSEHILAAGDIPVVQSDRGGQVTYHGPGQTVVYYLLDLKRLQLSVRDLVTLAETVVIDSLAAFGIEEKPSMAPLVSMLMGRKLRRSAFGSEKAAVITDSP